MRGIIVFKHYIRNEVITVNTCDKKPSSVLWITTTAIFIAILVLVQFLTSQFGTTLITGSLVNMLLIISAMTCGMHTGLTVAVFSPVLAKLIGIGPFWTIIPFIIIGNLVLVMIWFKIGNSEKPNRVAAWVIALIAAAVSKFLIIFLGVTKLTIPIILGIPKAQADIMSTAFSLPQLFTACIGGLIAIIMLPTIKKVIHL